SALDDALASLKSSEKETRKALHEQGIVLKENKEEPSADESALAAEGSEEVTQIHEEPEAVSGESSDSSETNAA
ncbi:MAG: hypothetical protein QGI45_04395, partial [Myxococcota bacterium]|nr:hypothetical protein [Myxococcota bacterium]